MAGIWIEGRSTLREVFSLLGAESWDCNWLMTDLECYDYEGWEGCEKWAESQLFLTNRQLLHDVELRDMQFIWGIFSALPAGCTEAEALAAGLPAFELNDRKESIYLSDTLLPQNSLAFLEISVEDSSSATVVSADPALLRSLYGLPEWTEDAEKKNRRFHQMRAMAGALTEELGWGGMNAFTRRNLYGLLWRALYDHRPDRPVREADVRTAYLNLWKEREAHG